MKILFLTSRIPYPPFRGDKLRVFNLLRRVARHHEIALVSLVQDRKEVEWTKDLKPFCSEIRLVYKSPAASLLSCGRAAFDSVPFQIAYFKSDKVREAIREVVDTWRPDLLHVHYIRMAQYAQDISHIPRIVDLTDSFSLYLGRRLQMTENPIMRVLIKTEHDRMREYESIIGKFECCLVCSPVDLHQLSSRAGQARMELFPNGVDLDTFTHDGKTLPDPRRIIFTGNMSYFPNSDGAVYFAREIFPLIRQKVPEARFFIVGQNPPRNVRALSGDAITVTGFVPDLSREYMRSAVAVSPVRLGSGTLNKIIEPLALGVPVVTGSLGIAGLNLVHGRDALIADDPEDFARYVVDILTDSALRARLSTAGPSLVRTQFSWDRLAERLNDLYHEIVAAGARA